MYESPGTSGRVPSAGPAGLIEDPKRYLGSAGAVGDKAVESDIASDVLKTNMPRLKTPYATEFTVETMLPKVQLEHHADCNRAWMSERKTKLTKRTAQTHAANKTAGDIIAWRDGEGDFEDDGSGNKKRPVQLAGAASSSHDALSKEVKDENDNNYANTKNRGRRTYKNPESQHKAPFGTDSDHGRSAEECGTLEFRPATSMHATYAKMYG